MMARITASGICDSPGSESLFPWKVTILLILDNYVPARTPAFYLD